MADNITDDFERTENPLNSAITQVYIDGTTDWYANGHGAVFAVTEEFEYPAKRTLCFYNNACKVNQIVRVTIANAPGAGLNPQIMLIARSNDNTSKDTFYMAVFLAAAAGAGIYKCINGTFTNIVWDDEISYPTASAAFKVAGNTLHLYADGLLVKEITDSSIPSGEYVGFSAYLTANATGNIELSGFTAETSIDIPKAPVLLAASN
jgi:hypothetical protein